MLGMIRPEEILAYVNKSNIGESIYACHEDRFRIVERANLFPPRENGSIPSLSSGRKMERILSQKSFSAHFLMILNILRVSSRDITERKRADEQLRKLSLAVEQNPASIVITDTKEHRRRKSEVHANTGYTLRSTREKSPILKSGRNRLKNKKYGKRPHGDDLAGDFHNKRKTANYFGKCIHLTRQG